jgi:hypothetical protein
MYCFTMLSGAPPTEPAKYEPDHRPFVRLAQPPGGDSLEADYQLGYAIFGGKFTSRWTWLFSPLTSTSLASKSSHTARMISSHRVRCRSAKTECLD